MMTVNEVSKLTGVSIRALQYYDKIGLLHPAEYTEAGYRLYDDTALERLQQILLFRELEFSLKEIQSILQSPDFDRDRALDQQICLLTLKKEHIENLITFARGLKQVGGMNMDFSAFDTAKMDEYATKAKEKWQHTNAYQEYTQKNKGRSKDAEEALARGVMLIFSDFGKCKDGDPALPEAQALVKRLQAYISENYYQCTPEILQTLGAMYKALQRIMRDCNSEVLEKKGVDSDPVLLPKFSCHVLRHTFATRMCESGLNVKVVQSVLGHADVTTTLDIYVTVTNDLKKREITAFETYLKTGAKQMANV